ncbi:MAG: ribosome maturation factor RimP [Pseudomonadota bacterium]
MAWQEAVRDAVAALGFETVEVQRASAGLLRVTIDRPYQPEAEAALVTVDDCEAVTRQLQWLLDVENVDYQRLEVGSPGVDRLLRNEADCQRFEGEWVALMLHQPIGTASAGVGAARKRFRGILQRNAEAPGWLVAWQDLPAASQPGRRPTQRTDKLPWQVLAFEWSDVREMRLSPELDFKGRGRKGPGQSMTRQERAKA